MSSPLLSGHQGRDTTCSTDGLTTGKCSGAEPAGETGWKSGSGRCQARYKCKTPAAFVGSKRLEEQSKQPKVAENIAVRMGALSLSGAIGTCGHGTEASCGAVQAAIIIRAHSNAHSGRLLLRAALHQSPLFHNPAVPDAGFIPNKSAALVALPGD